MSRSGYSDDCDGSELNLWRGAVNSAIKGKRGQTFLRETLSILDAMPDKRLISNSLNEPSTGEFCTLGVVGSVRGLDMESLEASENSVIARCFGISNAMACEIINENDEGYWGLAGLETPEQRWTRMRLWVSQQIIEARAHEVKP